MTIEEFLGYWDPCCWFFLIFIITFFPMFYGYSLKVEKWKVTLIREQRELKKELREIEVINGKERQAIETLEKENKNQNHIIKLLQDKIVQLEKQINGEGK